jgi:hypothetical protein
MQASAPDPYIAPAWPAQPASTQPLPQPAAWPASSAAKARTGRPAAVTVISVFALLGAFISLFGVISPVPGFLFGVVIAGWPLHLYSILWAAGLAIAGLGMLRLQRPAWQLAFVLLAFQALNFVVLLLPGPRTRYVAFLVSQNPMFSSPKAALPANLVVASVSFGNAIGLAFAAFIAFMLWRARWAFHAAPPLPPEENPDPN